MTQEFGELRERARAERVCLERKDSAVTVGTDFFGNSLEQSVSLMIERGQLLESERGTHLRG